MHAVLVLRSTSPKRKIKKEKEKKISEELQTFFKKEIIVVVIDVGKRVYPGTWW